MAFINWGEETPEQLENRRKMDEQIMFEQAAFNAATAAAAAAGIGSGGLLRDKSKNLYVESDYIDDYFA